MHAGFCNIVICTDVSHAMLCSFMAWNWYPPVPEGGNKLPPRLHGHADMDVITLLYQRTGATAFSLSVIL